MKRWVALALVAGLIPVAAAAQTDPRLRSAVQLAAEGLPDSANAIVTALLATTPVTDTLYPQVLYTQGAIARTAAEMRRAFQKVAVEYPTSAWADDALLRLMQMDFASKNYDGTVRGAEQLRGNDPSSPLLPAAAHWAARAEFELADTAAGCAWVARGLTGSSADVEARNQLEFLQGRCTAGPAPADTARAPANPPKPMPVSDTWGVQVAAVSSQASANAVLAQLKEIGMTGVVVPEGGSLFKVRVMGYPSRAAADSAVARIKAQLGGTPFVLVP